MSHRRCPYCGQDINDNKVYRLAMYVGDKRIRVFPQGTVTFSEAKRQTRVIGDAYLMAEVLDEESGRLISALQVAESLYETDENHLLHRKNGNKK